MSATQPAIAGIPETISEYYQREFQKMRDSSGEYQGKWNWAACLAGPVWALRKGLQAIFVVYVLAIIFTFGLSILFYAYVLGKRGNFMYYTKLTTGRSLLM